MLGQSICFRQGRPPCLTRTARAFGIDTRGAEIITLKRGVEPLMNVNFSCGWLIINQYNKSAALIRHSEAPTRMKSPLINVH